MNHLVHLKHIILYISYTSIINTGIYTTLKQKF